jgi:glycine hydroxymethyltransferase
MLSLTASENFISFLVRIAHAIRAGSFYFFAPPFITEKGEWYFPSSGVMEKFVRLLSGVAHSLFEIELIDWRPNGGSAAENAVMMGVCRNIGDAIIHFAHSDGGHFAIEPFAKKIGVQIFHLPVNQRTLLIDVSRLETMLKENPNIKLVLLDQSFKLREQPLREIKSILPENVVLCYDASHDGGLIAGGRISQPLSNGADIIIFNTHKTIPGPQKAVIGYKDKDNMFVRPISQCVVDVLQSNCHAECLLPMLIAFKELELFAAPYADQTIRNAKAFARKLKDEGFNVSGEEFDFTETHQVHVILGDADKALNTVMKLHDAGIRTNNIEIPGSNGAHGLRLGTQAMTRCGMKEHDFEEVARLMSKLILEKHDASSIRLAVDSLDRCFGRFPLKYSFDQYMGEGDLNDILTTILQ